MAEIFLHYNNFFIWFKIKDYLDVVAAWWSKDA